MLLALCALALGQTFVVDPSGAGDFLDVITAVAAAQDGDEILVLPGSYPGNITTSKALSLHGQPSPAVPGGVEIEGSITVSGAASFNIENLRVLNLNLLQIPGPVRVFGQGVALVLFSPYPNTNPLLNIDGCPDVLVEDSNLTRIGPPLGFTDESVAALVKDSSVAFVDTYVISGPQSCDGIAAIATEGTVELEFHGCFVHAGSGGASPPGLVYYGAPMIESSPTGSLDVLIAGSSWDVCSGANGFVDHPDLIEGPFTIEWSGAKLNNPVPHGTQEIPARPYLEIETPTGTQDRDINVYGPPAVQGVVFFSVMPLLWSDPLVTGSDLYLSPLGIFDFQAITMNGQDVPASLHETLPSWAAALPGFTIGVQAITFTGPTGLAATNPAHIIFD